MSLEVSVEGTKNVVLILLGTAMLFDRGGFPKTYIIIFLRFYFLLLFNVSYICIVLDFFIIIIIIQSLQFLVED